MKALQTVQMFYSLACGMGITFGMGMLFLGSDAAVREGCVARGCLTRDHVALFGYPLHEYDDAS